MADSEWRELQERLRTARTPQEKTDAAEAMRRYIQRKGKGSKPTLVTLRRGGGSANAIPLQDLPQAMIESPDVYERVRKIITKEK